MLQGTHNGSQTITADGCSLYDVDMAQLAHLLLPQPDPSERDASDSLAEVIEHRHEDWLAQKAETVHCLLSAVACEQRPLAQAAVRSANTAVTRDVEVSVLFLPAPCQKSVCVMFPTVTCSSINVPTSAKLCVRICCRTLWQVDTRRLCLSRQQKL